MKHVIVALTLAAALSVAGVANAAPYGQAQKSGAAQGQITPHGLWDAR